MIYDNFIDFVLWKTHIILMNWSDFEINKVLSDVQKRSLYDPLIPLLGNMWPIKVKKRILHPWLGLDTKVVVPILEFRFKNMKLTSGLLNNYRVFHIEMFLLKWLWQIEIYKLDFAWRHLYIP